MAAERPLRKAVIEELDGGAVWVGLYVRTRSDRWRQVDSAVLRGALAAAIERIRAWLGQ